MYNISKRGTLCTWRSLWLGGIVSILVRWQHCNGSVGVVYRLADRGWWSWEHSCLGTLRAKTPWHHYHLNTIDDIVIRRPLLCHNNNVMMVVVVWSSSQGGRCWSTWNVSECAVWSARPRLPVGVCLSTQHRILAVVDTLADRIKYSKYNDQNMYID